ncbi:hypothetical protein PO909_013643 [Leuciscus waleckii]
MSSLYSRSKDLSSRSRKSLSDSPPSSPSPSTKTFRLVCDSPMFPYDLLLNERSKAHLPGEGPRGTFAGYVEWVLLHGFPLSVCNLINPLTHQGSSIDPWLTGPREGKPIPTMEQEAEPVPTMDPELEPTPATEPEPATISIPEPETDTISIMSLKPIARSIQESVIARNRALAH